MMLHVLHQRDWNIAESSFGQEMARLGVPHRFLVAPVSLRYTRKSELFLRIYPTLVWNTLRLGWRSLARSRPAPDAILLSTDIEALIVGTLRLLLRKRTLVVMQTLIVTPRRSAALNVLYMLYWRCIVRVIDVGICHARAEVANYAALFPRHVGKFVFIPFGTTVGFDPAGVTAEPGGEPVIVTAGRSGRDYLTLAKAVEGLPCRLRIICDLPGPVAGIPRSNQVEILTACFGPDYLRALATADIVAVPLAVDDISAGQMVFLQAAALGRAVVLTRTQTTTDYAEDGVDAVLVSRGDVAAMRTALAELLASPDTAARLGQTARDHFHARFSTEAYVRNVVTTITERVAGPAPLL